MSAILRISNDKFFHENCCSVKNIIVSRKRYLSVTSSTTLQNTLSTFPYLGVLSLDINFYNTLGILCIFSPSSVTLLSLYLLLFFLCRPLCSDLPICNGVEWKWLSKKEKGHVCLFDAREYMPIFLYSVLTMCYQSQKLQINNVHWNLSGFQVLKNKSGLQRFYDRK